MAKRRKWHYRPPPAPTTPVSPWESLPWDDPLPWEPAIEHGEALPEGAYAHMRSICGKGS